MSEREDRQWEGLPGLFCETCNGNGVLTMYDMRGDIEEIDCYDCKGNTLPGRVYAPDTENPWETVTPYAGSSGWSGSDTSKRRADDADSSGLTGRNQKATLELAAEKGPVGITWIDVAQRLRVHHGSASNALSVLHKEGYLARLSERRDRCKVYVLPKHVNGRPVEDHGRKPKPCPNCGWEAA